MTKKDYIQELVSGYNKFYQGAFCQESFRELVTKGQQPHAMVIACCDSRVDPAFLFDCQPGDLFTVRNVANLIPPYDKGEAYYSTSAALEFGICGLNVPHLVLLGHTQCGGIQLLMQHKDNPPAQPTFLSRWLDLAKDIPDLPLSSYECRSLFLERESLKKSFRNLITFPWIAERIARKELSVHVWIFHIKTGELEAYDPISNQYHPIN